LLRSPESVTSVFSVSLPLQQCDLTRRQVAKLARPDVLVADRPDANAPEPHNRVAYCVAHVAHLAVPPFLDDEP
jgi:hypothetical protein